MALTLEYAFTIAADLGEVREVGNTHAGVRRVIPIVGGTITGPLLTGDVLPGGADWNVVRPDGAIHIWARYEIRISDGPIVSVVNEGLAYSDAEAPTPETPRRYRRTRCSKYPTAARRGSPRGSSSANSSPGTAT